MFDKDTNQDLDELIRRTTQVEIPDDVEGRLRGRLAEFRTRVERAAAEPLADAGLFSDAPADRSSDGADGDSSRGGGARAGAHSKGSSTSRVFAAAAAQLRSSQSLAYTIVLNSEPYVGVDFSYLAPGYRRLNCSWGIEVRTDGTTGKQIVLMHGARIYLTEGGKQVESQANTEDFAQQLRSLPQTADEVLGEQWTGEKKLIGYRLRKAPPNGSIPGLKELDIWIDTATREAHHVDITVQEQGKPAHQMHIQNIRVGANVDRSLFDLTPPEGYTPIAIPSGEARTGEPAIAPNPFALQVQIAHSSPLTAVVMPMHGSYTQTRFALETVESYLKTLGVTPVGPPFGRFGSEQGWDAGYPVPAGTRVDAPFQIVSMPGRLTASAVAHGAWAKDSGPRWAAFLKSVCGTGLCSGWAADGDVVGRGYAGRRPNPPRCRWR